MDKNRAECTRIHSGTVTYTGIGEAATNRVVEHPPA